MDSLLSAPATAAQRQRDRLLGALIGLARATVNEPKTEDTDHVLAAGLRQAARADAAEDALRRTEEAIQAALDEVKESRVRFRATSNEQMQANQEKLRERRSASEQPQSDENA